MLEDISIFPSLTRLTANLPRKICDDQAEAGQGSHPLDVRCNDTGSSYPLVIARFKYSALKTSIPEEKNISTATSHNSCVNIFVLTKSESPVSETSLVSHQSPPGPEGEYVSWTSVLAMATPERAKASR